MIRIESKENCSGCFACAMVCPQKCISMMHDEEGFLYPNLDVKQCVKCGLCKKVCPIISNSVYSENRIPIAYAAINREEDIRRESSSGGVFSLIAEYVLGKNGVVFGAAFNERNEVEHICVTNKDDLFLLRGAKYVQSRVGDTYRRAEKFLEAGRYVLYSGTPCQIGGLKAYLRKEYDNLICQDIVCHGVPSPMVWQRYIKYREEKASAKVGEVSFRNKEYGWKRYSIQFVFTNANRYISTFANDMYMQAFLSDICLRPSCYNCNFKTLDRRSDITLADFWGIQNVLPEMDDDKGTSLVLVNSEKGMRILQDVSERLILKQVDIEKAIEQNPAAVESVQRPEKRDQFICKIRTKRFDKVVAKYRRSDFQVTMIRRVKRKLKALIWE